MPIRRPWRESTKLSAELTHPVHTGISLPCAGGLDQEGATTDVDAARQRATEVFGSSDGLSLAVHFRSCRWQNVRIVVVEPG